MCLDTRSCGPEVAPFALVPLAAEQGFFCRPLLVIDRLGHSFSGTSNRDEDSWPLDASRRAISTDLEPDCFV